MEAGREQRATGFSSQQAYDDADAIARVEEKFHKKKFSGPDF